MMGFKRLVVIVALAALAACLVTDTLAGPQFARTCRAPDPTKPSRTAKCQFFHTAAQPQQSGRPAGLCFERISDIQAIYFQQHPGGGNMAVVARQKGLMSLIALPLIGTGKAAKVLGTWLDLTPRVDSKYEERGLLSFAFHPNFVTNGRFFVSYICNGKKVPDCQGWCACSSTTGCNLGDRGATCSGNTIVSEYKAAGTDFSTATSLSPVEVKRHINFGRPFNNHNGGHIFFGKDGYLYYTSGDGGNAGDPFNFAQQTKTFLGKILRIDVDGPAAAGKNYGIPPSNPFVGDSNAYPEIYALGFRNPWRCDQDPVTGTILCGDVGQKQVEEVDIILPGRNYMWHSMEGNFTYRKAGPHGSPAATAGVQAGPVFQYLHHCSSKYRIECLDAPYAAVVGGVVYRSSRNACLQGMYLYNDVSGPMWAANIFPSPGQSRVSYRVKPKCAATSPLKCLTGDLPAIGSIWSWGKDINRDVYALGNMGVFRLVEGSRCKLAC